MQKVRISVITITYNSEKYLAQTIKSVRAQNWPNLQYLLIDGGSTDKTLDIVKANKDLFHTIISEPDKGISDAMNKGIQLCDGDIVGIINSDDWYEPTCFQKVAKAYLEGKYGVIHGFIRYWNLDNSSFIQEAKHQLLKEEMTINHPTCFVANDVYKKYGSLSLKYKYAMDYDLMLRFYNSGVSFYCINEVLANMRLDGVSDKNWFYAFNEVRQIQEFNLKNKLLARLIFIKNITRHALGRLLSYFGLGYIKSLWRKHFAKIIKK